MARAPANPGLIRVDLLAFTLGLTSYAELVGGKAEGASEAVLKSGARHCIRTEVSEAMIEFLNGIQHVFEQDPASPQMLLSVLKQAETKRGTARFLFVGTKLPAIFNWFQAHLADFQDILPGPARSSIQPLLKLGDMASPLQRLKALGEFEYRSTFRVFRRWILEEALPSLGLEPTGVRAVVADIAAAKPYVEELRAVQQDLEGLNDAGSEEAADLNEQKVDLQEKISGIVEESTNPNAVETAVGIALSGENALLAQLAQKYKLDDEQAKVVATPGNVIVSAGAGSGKTTTLIAVIQYCLEQGYRPDQILGTTFSKAAETEFNERLEKKGVEGVGFGTTHSIARKIVLAGAPHLASQLDKPERADTLWEIACDQVEMEPSRMAEVPPPDLTEEPIEPEQEPTGEMAMLEDQRKRVKFQMEKNPWADFLPILWGQLTSSRPKLLTPRQLESLVRFETRSFRPRRGSISDDFQMFDIPVVASVPGEKTPWRDQPANQWWNMGMALESPRKTLRTQVGLWQNSGVSWQEAWKKYGEGTAPKSVFDEEGGGDEGDAAMNYQAAACFAAYVWLKKNDPQYGPVMDFDDYLGKAVEVLKRKPALLKSMQQRIKVMIVDEAQDLNGLQWELFGMLSEKTERYMLVGDDFQSIYAFRAADVDQFIEKPEQGFKLLQITTNYRSGRDIVETANTLISHNKKQIKKTCRATRANGDGQIVGRIVPSHNDVAEQTAADISSEIESGAKASDFGIAVRNRAEMDAFCLALMAKRIPYICDRDPLKGIVPRSAISWFNLALGSGKVSSSQLNEAITRAHQKPGFFLNEVFASNLREIVPNGSDQLQTLLSGARVYYNESATSKRNQNVAAYANAIRELQGHATSSMSLFQAILDIKSEKGSFLEVLKKDVNQEDLGKVEDEGELEEAITQAALTPLRPIMAIAESIPNPMQFVEYVEKLSRAKELSTLKRGHEEPAVRINTTHGWKGLEAKNMVVVMAHGVFPSPFADTEKKMEEERRLAYVAITRGKQKVTVYSPLESYRGPPPRRIGMPPPPPRASMFMEEMVGGSCMPLEGQELIQRGERPVVLQNTEAPSEEEVDSEPQVGGNVKFARSLMASVDSYDDAPVDSIWKTFV